MRLIFEKKQDWLAWSVCALLCVGIFIYALTRAFVWDEGFHLVAAQMIMRGKRPYLDFCFPQTPLNAYWNALWMQVFGQSWRVPHIPAALQLSAALALVTWYMLKRFPEGAWRVPCTIAALLFFGANAIQIQFGPIAQAYALCALTGVIAFLLTIRATARANATWALLSGISAGIGCASSLLVAPLPLVLLVWIWIKNEAGNRLIKAVAFCFGVLIPFAEVIRLAIEAPYPVWFNLVTYQALFRRVDWTNGLAGEHDFDVLTGWVDCGQVLLIALLAAAAIIALLRARHWQSRARQEFFLALSISIALVAFISTAHPTFSRYYIVGMPFYALVAAPGLMVFGSRLLAPEKPFWPALTLYVLLLLSLARSLYDDSDAATWQRYEDITAQVNRVTPKGAKIYADEAVYFLRREPPPPGMEFSYSHKVDLPPAKARLLHIIPMQQLKEQVEHGEYATLETCDDDKIDSWHLADLYAHEKDVVDCSVFWDFKGKSQ